MSDAGTVATSWKMDTAAAVKALDELKTAIVGAGQAAGEAKEKHEGLGKWFREGWEDVAKFSEKLFFVAEAADKINEAFGKASEIAHFSAEMRNLEANVPVERLKMMQEATEGAVKKTDLMRFSMKALSGDLHVTEAGMEVVLKAANTLSDKGFGETMEIADKLMESLRRGSSRGLHEFGIALTDTADKTKNVAKELEAFRKLAEEEVHVDAGLKEIERVQIAWANFVNDVKSGLGSIVVEIAKGIAELLDLMPKSHAQKVQTSIDEAARAYADERVPGVRLGKSGPGDLAAFGVSPTATEDYLRMDRGASDAWIWQEKQRGLDWWVAYSQGLRDQSLLHAGVRQRGQLAGLGSSFLGGAIGTPRLFEGSFEPGAGGGAAGRQRDFLGINGIVANLNNLPGEASTAYQFGPGLSIANWAERNKDYWTAATPDNGFSLFDTFLGPSQRGVDQQEKLEGRIKDRTSLLGGAFDTLSQGLSAAVDAAITGSDNIGKAFMKASAAALKSIATESTVRALYETAMGLGSAIFSPEAAAGHFAAAATFAAAAAAAGAGAAVLGSGAGGGGGSPSTPAGGGYASAGGGTAGGPGGQQTHVYIIDSYVGGPDELAVKLSDSINHGVQSGRVKTVLTGRPGAVQIK